MKAKKEAVCLVVKEVKSSLISEQRCCGFFFLQNASGIVRTQKKILTMAIKKKLHNMAFLSNKNHSQSFYFAIFFLASHGYRSVKPI